MTLETITEIVAEELGLTQQEILSPSRLPKYVEARYILFDALTKRAYPQKSIIEFVNRDRSMISYGIRQLKSWLTYDKELRKKYERIIVRLDNLQKLQSKLRAV